MSKDKNKDDIDRKDFRRKNLKNKFLDKRNRIEDEYIPPKARKEIKKKMQDIRADEILEDWEEYYDLN